MYGVACGVRGAWCAREVYTRGVRSFTSTTTLIEQSRRRTCGGAYMSMREVANLDQPTTHQIISPWCGVGVARGVVQWRGSVARGVK
jgi:hypothetical protein